MDLIRSLEVLLIKSKATTYSGTALHVNQIPIFMSVLLMIILQTSQNHLRISTNYVGIVYN